MKVYKDGNVYKVALLDGKYYAYSKVGRVKNSSGIIPDAPVIPETPVEPDVPTEPVTLVGNTKIENGILSGFDADSYAIVNYTLPNDLTSHEFEIAICVIPITAISKVAILDTNKDTSLCGWGLSYSNGFLIWGSGDGISYSHSSDTSKGKKTNGHTYEIKITNKGYNEPNVIVNDLTDATTIEYGAMPSTPTPIHGVIALGMAGSDQASNVDPSNVASLGEQSFIDLTNCYIEIDGVKVWQGVTTS